MGGWAVINCLSISMPWPRGGHPSKARSRWFSQTPRFLGEKRQQISFFSSTAKNRFLVSNRASYVR